MWGMELVELDRGLLVVDVVVVVVVVVVGGGGDNGVDSAGVGGDR